MSIVAQSRERLVSKRSKAVKGQGTVSRKSQKLFRAPKAIFKNGEVYTPETSYMKETSLHIKKMRIKQLYNRKDRDFAMALRARKVSGAFEKWAPGTKNEYHGMASLSVSDFFRRWL